MCNKMSDVRLSNASPTVERVDARQPDNFTQSVRRNLFGTPDPEEIRRYVTETLQEGVQDFRERYGFDPVEHRPLTQAQGNYVWEEDSSAPEFYRREPHRRQLAQRGVDLDGRDQRQENGERSPESDSKKPRKRRSDGPGSCSNDCQSKILHTDEDDEDEDGAGSFAVRPNRPESSSEVH